MRWALFAFLFLWFTCPTQAQGWEFDTDNPVTVGTLRYALDAQRLAAQCVGPAEGQEGMQTATVPATISSGGSTYQVMSIGEGAFLKAAALKEARFESLQLQVGMMVFTTALEHLYLSAATPPQLEYYLIIDPNNLLSVLSDAPMTRIHVPKGSARAYLQNEWWALYMLTEGDDLSLTIATQRAGTLPDFLRSHDIVPQLVNHLTVSGPIGESDWRFIGDSLPNLLSLDMQEALTTMLPKTCFNRSKLSTIVLPRTLKRIGATAFTACRQLEELVIPEGVEVLEGSGSTSATVFNCPKMKRIDLPSTLAQVGGSLVYRVSWGDGGEPALTINSRAFFPPKVGGSVILDAMYAGPAVTVEVPAMGATYYAADNKWSSFSRQTTDQQPATMTIYSPRTLDTGLLAAGYQPDVKLGTLETENYYYRKDNFGALTVSGQQPFNAGELTLYADLPNDRSYSDHYCSDLLVEAPMTARHLNVDMLVGDGRWFFISFPFDVKLSEVAIGSDISHWVVRQYSSRNRAQMRGEQWVDVPFSSTLKANQGYIWRFATGSDADTWSRSDLQLTVSAVEGTQHQAFATSDTQVPLTDHAATYPHNANWNLVGNPFPCYYDTRTLQPAVPFTVWNHSYQEYRTYSPLDDSYELAPFEAFFLQKPANASQLTFSANGRVSPAAGSRGFVSAGSQEEAGSRESVGGGSRESVGGGSPAAVRVLVNLELRSGPDADRTRIVLNPAAQEQYELGRDAAKFFSPDEQKPQLYTLVDQQPCAIDERPEGSGTVSIGIRTGSEQQCTIALDDRQALPALLEDRLTGTLADLSKGSYTFLSRQGRDDQRFLLHIGAAATGISDINSATAAAANRPYNLQGQPVGDNYRGIVIEKNGRLTIKR